VVDMASTEIRSFIKKHKKGLAAVALLAGIIESHFDKVPIKEEALKSIEKPIEKPIIKPKADIFYHSKLMNPLYDEKLEIKSSRSYISNEKIMCEILTRPYNEKSRNYVDYVLIDNNSRTAYLWSNDGTAYMDNTKGMKVLFDSSEKNKFSGVDLIPCNEQTNDNFKFKIPKEVKFIENMREEYGQKLISYDKQKGLIDEMNACAKPRPICP
jgi:hypothetical protein